jgi:hypothetical protein
MSATFDKLKELLKAQGTLSNEEMEKAIAESGPLTPEEITALESEKLELAKAKTDTVSMDDYLAALKVLDSAAEGSDEYKKAEALVEKYESGA